MPGGSDVKVATVDVESGDNMATLPVSRAHTSGGGTDTAEKNNATNKEMELKNVMPKPLQRYIPQQHPRIDDAIDKFFNANVLRETNQKNLFLFSLIHFHYYFWLISATTPPFQLSQRVNTKQHLKFPFRFAQTHFMIDFHSICVRIFNFDVSLSVPKITQTH